MGASGLMAQDCSDALVASTYRLQSTDNRDFRLASFVTEKQYEDAKHGGNANVLIYDVPVGADYSDFQSRSREMTNKLKVRITHEQAINAMWTGIPPEGFEAYNNCIDRQLSAHGVHMAVKFATPTQVTVKVRYVPVGRTDPPVARLAWTWAGDRAALPTTLPPGETTITLKRPSVEQQLTVNSNGTGDTVIISPLPPSLDECDRYAIVLRKPACAKWDWNRPVDNTTYWHFSNEHCGEPYDWQIYAGAPTSPYGYWPITQSGTLEPGKEFNLTNQTNAGYRIYAKPSKCQNLQFPQPGTPEFNSGW
jgi:hypothetical protein